MPFSWLSKYGASLLQRIIRRAAAVRGGIGDSSSWMKIAFFLCKIRFRTHQKKHPPPYLGLNFPNGKL